MSAGRIIIPYRAPVGTGVFVPAGPAAVLVTLAPIGWHPVKAALANPVNSLRNE